MGIPYPNFESPSWSPHKSPQAENREMKRKCSERWFQTIQQQQTDLAHSVLYPSLILWGIKFLVPSISISFKSECYIIMQMQCSHKEPSPQEIWIVYNIELAESVQRIQSTE